jgi:Flp pilus assembly protein TadD
MAKSLLARYPNTFLLHNVLGISLDGLGQYDGAINSYRNALKLQPNLPDLHFNLGIALGNVGQFDEASCKLP